MCLLDDYSFHELQLAACFLVASIAMVVYHRMHPGIRPNVMRMGFAISLLGADTLLAITLFFSPSRQPEWAQSLTNAFRILPFLAVLAYICRLTGTNQGTRDCLKTLKLLNRRPYELLKCGTENLFCSVAPPKPTLQKPSSDFSDSLTGSSEFPRRHLPAR